jgi:hypothetical protein
MVSCSLVGILNLTRLKNGRAEIRPEIDAPVKQDISTLLGIGHFYFALTIGLP